MARYHDAREKLAPEVLDMVNRANEPGHLADLLATQVMTDTNRRQDFLETAEANKRLEMIAVHLSGDLDVAELENRIQERVRDQVEKHQREYYLREQLKAIQDELSGDEASEIEALQIAIRERGMPEEIETRLLREVGRLDKMPAVSAEATVVRTYIETLMSLPWTESTVDRLQLDEAESILNDEHFGLEHVKERILDFLAVRQLREQNDVRTERKFTNPLPRRPSRRRKNQSRSVDCQRDGS